MYAPELWRVIPYLLCISLIGIFILLSLRERFVVKYGLPYPSCTASGVLINSLHSIGNKVAVRQVRCRLCTCPLCSVAPKAVGKVLYKGC